MLTDKPSPIHGCSRAAGLVWVLFPLLLQLLAPAHGTAATLEIEGIAFCEKDEWSLREARAADKEGRFQTFVPGKKIDLTERDAWLRARLHAPDAGTSALVISFDDYWVDFLALYYRSGNGIWQMGATGENVGLDLRSIPSRYPAVLVETLGAKEMEVFIHLQSILDFRPGFTIHTEPERFLARQSFRDLSVGVYLGILVGLFLYNLILNITLRRTEFTYYIAYLFFVALSYGLIRNLPLDFGLTIGSPWVTYLLTLSLVGLGLFMLRFAHDFLGHQPAVPSLAAVCRQAQAIYVVLGLASLGIILSNALVPEWQTSLVRVNNHLLSACIALPLIQTALLAAVGYKCARRGSREAFFFGLAFSMLLLGYLPLGLAQLGLYTPSPTLIVFMQVGLVAEMLLLAFALAEKMAAVRHEKEAALARAEEEEKQRQLLEASNKQIKKQTALLEALNKDKDALLGMAAHDLRNPLSGIDGIAELLDEDFDQPEAEKMSESEKREFLAHVRSDARHMLELINDLLDTSAVEGLAEDLPMQPINLGAVMEKATRFNARKAEMKRIHLATTIPEELHVLGNHRALLEIFDNLLSNAVKFSHEGSRVEFKVVAGAAPKVIVSDEGPGFTEADKEKLFQRFAKLSARPTGSESSTGLGLAIVRTLVSASELSIRLESEAGNGATFFVEGFKKVNKVA